MPLLDHFHPPLDPGEPWVSFHNYWVAAIGGQLNQRLPKRYRATIHTHLGRDVAADVAEVDCTPGREGANGAGGVAVAAYAPPAPSRSVAGVFPDDIEVRVNDTLGGLVVVAVIELVSPANKDRPDARYAFADKCAAYLRRGLGLMVVDIVTVPRANLHDALMERLGQADPADLGGATVYAAAYRPWHRDGQGGFDIWPAPLAVGGPLPTLPLALRGYGVVPVDLEAAYASARLLSGLA